MKYEMSLRGSIFDSAVKLFDDKLRGVLNDLLRQPHRKHRNTDFRIDDDRFPLVAGQGFCQNAGKHTFSAPWAAPDSNNFSHSRRLLSKEVGYPLTFSLLVV